MKGANIRVEEAPEVAKDLTYEKAWDVLANQAFVFASQDHRLNRVRGQVDWCITDSPLPLALHYAKDGRYKTPWFEQYVWGMFDSYDNVNIMLERVKPYQKYGRTQSEEEAREIDGSIRALMGGRIHFSVPGDRSAHKIIFERLMALNTSV